MGRVGSPRFATMHDGGIRAMAVAPRARLVAVAALDDKISVTPLVAGARPRRLSGHQGAITCLDVSGDERWLVSGGDDATVRLWNLATGAEERKLEGPRRSVSSVAFSPSGRVVAAGVSDGTIDMGTLAEQMDAALWLWQVPGGRLYRRFPVSALDRVAFAGDRGLLGIVRGQAARLLDVTTGQLRDPIGRGVGTLAFSPSGDLLAIGCADATAVLHDTRTTAEVARLEAHDDTVSALAFLPSGGLLATGGWDGKIAIWDVATRSLRGTLEGHKGRITALAWASPNELVSAGSDAMVLLWGLA